MNQERLYSLTDVALFFCIVLFNLHSDEFTLQIVKELPFVRCLNVGDDNTFAFLGDKEVTPKDNLLFLRLNGKDVTTDSPLARILPAGGIRPAIEIGIAIGIETTSNNRTARQPLIPTAHDTINNNRLAAVNYVVLAA